MYIRVFHKRHFVKEQKRTPPQVTRGYLGCSYIEGEADRTSQGSPPRHLKFHNFYIVYFHSAISQPSHRVPSENLQCKNCETSSALGDPLDLCDQPLLLEMNFLGTPQLSGGGGGGGGCMFFSFSKCLFVKHPSVYM